MVLSFLPSILKWSALFLTNYLKISCFLVSSLFFSVLRLLLCGFSTSKSFTITLVIKNSPETAKFIHPLSRLSRVCINHFLILSLNFTSSRGISDISNLRTTDAKTHSKIEDCCWWNDSIWKGAFHQAPELELDYQDPYGAWWDPAPINCPLASLPYIHYGTHPS